MFFIRYFFLFQSLMTPLAGFAFLPLPSSSLFLIACRPLSTKPHTTNRRLLKLNFTLYYIFIFFVVQVAVFLDFKIHAQ